MGLKEYTIEEVQKHKSKDDCWIVLHGRVLDITSFLDEHPGGREAILMSGGQDATEEFEMMHPENYIDKYVAKSVIGKLKGSSKL